MYLLNDEKWCTYQKYVRHLHVYPPHKQQQPLPQDAMVQRVLLPKTSSDGKGASSDDGTSSTTEGDEAAATNAPAPTVANGEPPPSQQHPRQDTAVAESAWAPPPHGITVRSFIRTAVGSRSLKQRLEALRHRAHTGRWDDAILQPVRFDAGLMVIFVLG